MGLSGGRIALQQSGAARSVLHNKFELMVKYGMKTLAVLQADMINGAKLLGWGGQIGTLKAGYYADIVAVPGSPLDDISDLEHVWFVMKDGVVFKAPPPSGTAMQFHRP